MLLMLEHSISGNILLYDAPAAPLPQCLCSPLSCVTCDQFYSMPTFNHEASLRAFSKFQILDDHIQSIILQMLKDDRFNSYGSLKRPPNAWLIFRSDMLATNPEMSTMSQAEVTVRCKSRWAVATLQERMELQARARRASDELLQYFPDYSYKPMSKAEKERWKGLGAHQRKDFWLSSAVRIAERIANPSEPWDGFLTLEKWSEDTPAGSLGTSNNPSLAATSLQPYPWPYLCPRLNSRPVEHNLCEVSPV
ncbi:hypothetical protein B0J17DRAFT_60990 [Rhizoctonia solani]|nr:hypothetical protein B0J17DRAFT_60990 [Rhizoctonia solani]